MGFARVARVSGMVVLLLPGPGQAAARIETSVSPTGIPRPPRLGSEPLVYATADDPARFRRWSLGDEGLQVSELGAPPQRVHLEQWLAAQPWHACAPGLLVRRDGSAVVSTNVIPRLYVIDARTFEATVHEIAIAGNPRIETGFTDLREGPPGLLHARSSLDYSMWSIDLRKGLAVRIRDRAEHEKACQ